MSIDLLTGLITSFSIETLCIVRILCKELYRNINNNCNQFKFMPIFRKCNDFGLYLEHYNSWTNGDNFPIEQPLWLYEDVLCPNFCFRDGGYHLIPKIISYSEHKIDGKTPPKCSSGYEHYLVLSDEEKYLLWCGIRNKFPEIKMVKERYPNKNDVVALLSESYWHYSYSFVARYLELFLHTNNNLSMCKTLAINTLGKDSKDFGNKNIINSVLNIDDNMDYIIHVELNKEDRKSGPIDLTNIFKSAVVMTDMILNSNNNVFDQAALFSQVMADTVNEAGNFNLKVSDLDEAMMNILSQNNK